MGVATAVEISIEELVLEGFSASARYAIAEALERELTRLLAEQGTPFGWQTGRELEHLDAGALEWHPHMPNASVGAAIGRAVYESFDGSINTTNRRA